MDKVEKAFKECPDPRHLTALISTRPKKQGGIPKYLYLNGLCFTGLDCLTVMCMVTEDRERAAIFTDVDQLQMAAKYVKMMKDQEAVFVVLDFKSGPNAEKFIAI